MAGDVIILGCGFTGSRVATLLARRGFPVTGIRRRDIDFTQADAAGALRDILTPGCLVLHSIPSLPSGADAKLVPFLGESPRRVVYLSTTGVYGDQESVDESTQPQPHTQRGMDRLATEQAIRQGPWESLILRPAAIYGPDRGVHVAMAQGRYALMGDGGNFISRIHVDDLAAIAAAAITSELTGAFPVADEHPCSAAEIAAFCSLRFGLPPAECAPLEAIPESRRTNRRVDGRAICRLLGIQLRFPSYRQGIPACTGDEFQVN